MEGQAISPAFRCLRTLDRVLLVGGLVVGICFGTAVVWFRVDGLARRRPNAHTIVFETQNEWVMMVGSWALGGAVLITAVGWPFLWPTPLPARARRALQLAGTVVATAFILLMTHERGTSRVTIDADRELVIIESRSFADVALGSSGESRVIPLGEVTTVRWTYRRPDGENAELGRVQVGLINDPAVTIGWEYPTTVAYELASMIASFTNTPLRCDEHGDGVDGDTEVCRV